jgi:hypothetical protein
MILQNRSTHKKIKVTRAEYYKTYRQSHYWVDITPEPTPKQVAHQEKFVKMGKLYRARSNLQEIIRVHGSYHGIFSDAINGLTKLIEELK